MLLDNTSERATSDKQMKMINGSLQQSIHQPEVHEHAAALTGSKCTTRRCKSLYSVNQYSVKQWQQQHWSYIHSKATIYVIDSNATAYMVHVLYLFKLRVLCDKGVFGYV